MVECIWMSSSRTHFILNNPLQFVKQVFKGFRANQGFLLSGAIAYYTLEENKQMNA